MRTIPEEVRRKLFKGVWEGQEFEDWGIKDENEWRGMDFEVRGSAIEEIEEDAQMLWSEVEPHLEELLQRYPNKGIERAPVTAGWHLYYRGKYIQVEADDLPKAMCLDVEAVQSGGQWHPICAVAIGSEHIYVWIRQKELYPSIPDVIPFPDNRIVVGWNVSYDRQMLNSELSLEDSHNRFIDGRAFMAAQHAISEQQTAAYAVLTQSKWGKPAWWHQASKTGLDTAYAFLFSRPLDKSLRMDIKKMKWDEWNSRIDEIVKYCATDVIATLRCTDILYKRLRKDYVQSLVSLVGQMEMGSGIVPLSRDWHNYIARSEAAYADIETRHTNFLIQLAHRKNDNDNRLEWRALKSGPNKGEPVWRKDYLKEKPTMGMRTSVILLDLQWKGRRLEWEKRGKSGAWVTEDEELPHPDGADNNLCNPLIADFLPHVENDILTSPVLPKLELIKLYKELESLTNWRSIAGRCNSVRAVKSGKGFVVVPQTLVMGTQSRRATDNTWLVAVKADEKKIGSEFRGLVEVPDSHRIVGADFDQEELVLAAMLGDKLEGRLASSQFCRSILVGDKSKKTDVHSLVAARQEVKRDLAKTMNFAAQYFCGAKKLAITIRSERADLTEVEAIQLARKYIYDTRGTGTTYYIGGIASNIFNAMLVAANTSGIRSPILGFKIPASLDSLYTRKEYLTTKANWIIQTSGVDIMHLMMVALRAGIRRMGLFARLMLTLHDEIRFVVPVDEVERFAALMQEAHIKVMAYAYAKMGFNTMPVSQAWFSAVDVDTRLRKEVTDLSITPTNPKGFPVTGFSLSV